jgi:hypothetical protein
MTIDRLVLVLGAGASRNLGGSEPLPLMPGWSEVVRQALDQQDVGLARLVGITPGQSGPDFERAIGDFLAWLRVLELNIRYLPVGLQAGAPLNALAGWDDMARGRAGIFVKTLNRTLYEQFGGQRLSDYAAANAYGNLLDALQLRADSTLTVATTNYDPAVESGLQELNRRPDVGAVPAPGRTTILDPTHLMQRCEAGRAVAVLHLHGKVGWYTQPDGTVRIDDDRGTFNEHSGTPTVLMPDPEKDPLAEPAIRVLWEQFDLALGQATHVIVLGHSLHDPVLVEHLRRRPVATALCVHPEAGDDETAFMVQELPHADTAVVDFGPSADLANLQQWASEQTS